MPIGRDLSERTPVWRQLIQCQDIPASPRLPLFSCCFAIDHARRLLPYPRQTIPTRWYVHAAAPLLALGQPSHALHHHPLRPANCSFRPSHWIAHHHYARLCRSCPVSLRLRNYHPRRSKQLLAGHFSILTLLARPTKTNTLSLLPGPLRRYPNRERKVRPCPWLLPPCFLQEHARDCPSHQRLEGHPCHPVPRECQEPRRGRPHETLCREHWSHRPG
jgi:hypothetical protein